MQVLFYIGVSVMHTHNTYYMVIDSLVKYVQPSSQPFPPGRLPASLLLFFIILLNIFFRFLLLFLDSSVSEVIPTHVFFFY